jgi:hypothetical protein
MDTPAPDYDAVPLVWDIGQNTVTNSQTPVVHVNGKYSTYPLHWFTGAPLLAVQVWDYSSNKPLLTATSDNAQILVPPEGTAFLFRLSKPGPFPLVRSKRERFCHRST